MFCFYLSCLLMSLKTSKLLLFLNFPIEFCKHIHNLCSIFQNVHSKTVMNVALVDVQLVLLDTVQ